VHLYARIILLALIATVAGCTAFPQARPGTSFADQLTAAEVFDRSLAAHGGDIREYPGDINIATDGRWYSLIQRIQPVVSDADFRVTSEERFRPRDGIYAIRHSGPAGNKYVLRTPSGISVHYNGVAVDAEDERLRATAMTNDAFQLFHFGPSFVKHRATTMTIHSFGGTTKVQVDGWCAEFSGEGGIVSERNRVIAKELDMNRRPAGGFAAVMQFWAIAIDDVRWQQLIGDANKLRHAPVV